MNNPPPTFRDAKRQAFEALRRAQRQPVGGAEPALAFSVAEIDAVLPWGGLPRACLHEIAGLAQDAAATGFVVWLSGLLAGAGGWVLWCRSVRRGAAAGRIYGPAVARFGLDTDRLLFVETDSPQDLLWAMEEGLRARRFAAVIGEGVTPDLIQTRRLQLAAETGVTTALLLVPPDNGRISAAMTRWIVQAGAADRPGLACWRLRLERCRGGAHGLWSVEWNDETLCLRLAAPLADRPLATPMAAAE
jgi:protein ImuA